MERIRKVNFGCFKQGFLNFLWNVLFYILLLALLAGAMGGVVQTMKERETPEGREHWEHLKKINDE